MHGDVGALSMASYLLENFDSITLDDSSSSMNFFSLSGDSYTFQFITPFSWNKKIVIPKDASGLNSLCILSFLKNGSNLHQSGELPKGLSPEPFLKDLLLYDPIVENLKTTPLRCPSRDLLEILTKLDLVKEEVCYVYKEKSPCGKS